MAETKKSGLSQSQGRGRETERQPRSECYCIYAREQATERPTQPRLGNPPDGLPSGLAGHRWPAGWWPTPKTGSNRNSRQAITDERGGGKHKSDLSLEQAAEVSLGILPREIKSINELPPQWQRRWPAGPGEQHPWEPPRIVATGVKDRVAKLKALGNAVVPAQAYPIFRAIRETEEAIT